MYLIEISHNKAKPVEVTVMTRSRESWEGEGSWGRKGSWSSLHKSKSTLSTY